MQQVWADQPPELWAWRDRAFQQVSDQAGPAVIFTHFMVINAIVGRLLERGETLCCLPDYASITHLRSSHGALELVALGREMKTAVN
jgi:probable phosphoglycerate mutase